MPSSNDFQYLLNESIEKERSHLANPISSPQEYLNNVKWLSQRLTDYTKSGSFYAAAQYILMILYGCSEPLSLGERKLRKFNTLRNKTISSLSIIYLAREMIQEPAVSEDFDFEESADTDGIIKAWKSFSLSGLALVTTLTPLEEIISRDKDFIKTIIPAK